MLQINNTLQKKKPQIKNDQIMLNLTRNLGHVFFPRGKIYQTWLDFTFTSAFYTE